jgi:hypothetical protein
MKLNMNAAIQTFQKDPLISFCEETLRKYAGKWPVSNEDLAFDFVDYFGIPFFPQMSNLNQLFLVANIELSIELLAKDLLGFNCSSNGKRKIIIDGSPENRFIRVHTAFHEIRELIEYIFCDFGFPTVNSNEKEECADEFASAVLMCASLRGIKGWYERAMEIQSTWKMLGALVLSWIAGLAVVFYALYCEVRPQLQHHSVDRRSK